VTHNPPRHYILKNFWGKEGKSHVGKWAAVTTGSPETFTKEASGTLHQSKLAVDDPPSETPGKPKGRTPTDELHQTNGKVCPGKGTTKEPPRPWGHPAEPPKQKGKGTPGVKRASVAVPDGKETRRKMLPQPGPGLDHQGEKLHPGGNLNHNHCSFHDSKIDKQGGGGIRGETGGRLSIWK